MDGPVCTDATPHMALLLEVAKFAIPFLIFCGFLSVKGTEIGAKFVKSKGKLESQKVQKRSLIIKSKF